MNVSPVFKNFIELNTNHFQNSDFLKKHFSAEFEKDFSIIDQAWQHLTLELSKQPSLALKKMTLLPSLAYQFDTCAKFFQILGATGKLEQNKEEVHRILTQILKDEGTNLALAEKILQLDFPLSNENWSILFNDEKYAHLVQKAPLYFLIRHETECLAQLKKEISKNLENFKNNLIKKDPQPFRNLAKVVSLLINNKAPRVKIFETIFQLYLKCPNFKEHLINYPALKQLILQQFDFSTFYKLCSTDHVDLLESLRLEFFLKHLKSKNFYQIELMISKENEVIHSFENLIEGLTEEQKKNFLTDAIFYNQHALLGKLVKMTWSQNLSVEDKQRFFEKSLEFSNPRLSSTLLQLFGFELPPRWEQWLEICKNKNLKKLSQQLIQYFFFPPFVDGSNRPNFFKPIHNAIVEEDEWRVKFFLDNQWIAHLNPIQRKDLIVAAWTSESESIACLLFDKGLAPPRHLSDKNNWLHLCYDKKKWYEYAKRLFTCGKGYNLKNSPSSIYDFLHINHRPFLLDQILLIRKAHEFHNHLRTALSYNNVWYIHQLLDVFPEYSIPNDLLEELFIFAIDHQHKELLKKIHTKCGDIDFIIEDKERNLSVTLFEYALDCFKTKLFDFFIENKATGTCFNLIHQAAWLKNLEEVKKLLSKDPPSLNSQAQNGYNLLHIAVVQNNVPLFHFVLKNKIDVNQKDILGNTPLHLAKKYGRTMMVNHLVRYLVDVNSTNLAKRTPLTTNTEITDFKILKKLIESNAEVKNDEYTRSFAYSAYLQTLNHQILNLFKSKIDISMIKESVDRTLLAHVWGIGGESKVKTFKFDLEGSYQRPAVKMIKTSLLKYYTQPKKRIDLNSISQKFHHTLLKSIKCLLTNLSCHPSKILKLLNKKIPVIIHSGWQEHALSIVFYQNRLVISNKGDQCGFYGIEVYEYDRDKLSEDIIRNIQKADDQEFITYTLLEQLDAQFLRGFQKKPQTIGNCTDTNLKTIPQILFYLLLENEQDYDAYTESHNEYKEWIAFYLRDSYQHYVSTRKTIDADFDSKINERALKKKIDLTPKKIESQETLVGATTLAAIMGFN